MNLPDQTLADLGLSLRISPRKRGGVRLTFTRKATGERLRLNKGANAARPFEAIAEARCSAESPLTLRDYLRVFVNGEGEDRDSVIVSARRHIPGNRRAAAFFTANDLAAFAAARFI